MTEKIIGGVVMANALLGALVSIPFILVAISLRKVAIAIRELGEREPYKHRPAHPVEIPDESRQSEDSK